MDLSKIAFEPRLRNGWEAIDLGCVMAKQWFLPLWLAWLGPSAVVMVILQIVLPGYSWVSLLVMWWLKPLWDRLPLLYASRALFGEHIAVKDLYKNCLHSFKADWFASITWRRLSPTRSFDLPLTVLEGLVAPARTQRMSGLHQTSGNAAIWLTVSCVFLEQVIATGIWGLLIILAPPDYQKSIWQVAFSEDVMFSHVSIILTYLVVSLIAPFYVVCGFALYICRRVELEAWDIEVRFRHLAARTEKKNQRAGRTLSWLMCFLFVVGAWVTPAETWAEEAEEPAFIVEYYDELKQHSTARDSKSGIIDVLSGEDFHNYELEKKWRFKPWGNTEKEKEDENPEGFYRFLDSLEKFFRFFKPLADALSGVAGLLEIVMWALCLSLIGYLIYRYRKGMMSLFGAQVFTADAPHEATTLFGMDVRRESLPEDVPAQVLRLWQENQAREAISLLYRATLSRLIYDFSFQFFDGYTEQECVSVVEMTPDAEVKSVPNRPALIDFVRRLTSVWQRIAYAHTLPDNNTVATLCKEWSAVFDRMVRP